MKKHYLLLATLFFTQVLSAAESKLIDDAPKGFIHIQEGGVSDLYLRADTVVRLEQFPDDEGGKTTHIVRIIAAGQVIMNFEAKEEAEKCMKKLLELLSVKN